MNTRRLYALVWACLLSLPTSLQAQTSALPADQIGWNQSASSLQDAQSYEYRLYVDGGSAGVVLNAICAGTPPAGITCGAPLPALVIGPHSVTMTASLVLPDGRRAESATSVPLAFTIVAIPATPTALRIEAAK
jgi:hypothetical protein